MHARYSDVSEYLESYVTFDEASKTVFFRDSPLSTLDNGVPSFVGEDRDQLTTQVAEFYNQIKFPNYDGMEDYSSIYNKGRNNNFSKALDDEISWDARVLELGCGTGQLSLFLGRGARDVHGLDISIGSLSLAEDFRALHNIANVRFFHMDVFDLHYQDDVFDVVISNGVLHHTKNAQQAFEILAKKTRPGGFIIIGLYHKYGRVVTKIKQSFAKLIGNKIFKFDHYSRNLIDEGKRKAWVQDQFFNPHETTHTPSEVLKWFDENNVEFINLLPHFYETGSALFSPKDRNEISKIEDFLLMFNGKQIKEGGFFVMVGKKNN